jgi:uncharacterized heparinase superfamily protein
MRHDASHVIIDCGEVGMHGRGGHGHNDILSFELVLDGTRVLTDCGSYVYTASREWRNRFRSTAMHNTVQVDGAEINRFISPDDLWRLRDDARPVDVCLRPSADHDYFQGAHTGYDREPHRIRHVREIVLDHEAPLVFLRDRLIGAGRHEFTWRFHFVPAAVLAVVDSSVRARIDGRDLWLNAVELPAGATWQIESSWVSPRYGVKAAASVATVTWSGAAPSGARFVFGLAPLTPRDANALMTRFGMHR